MTYQPGIDWIAELRAEIDLWESRTKQGAEIILENVAEIERLRAELLSTHATLERWSEANKTLEATNAAMLAALKEVARVYESSVMLGDIGKRTNEQVLAAIKLVDDSATLALVTTGSNNVTLGRKPAEPS